MKKSDIYEITVKILGIYLFFNSIGLLSEVSGIVYAYLTGNGDNESEMYNKIPPDWISSSVMNIVITLLFAGLLTFKTRSIVKLICKDSDYTEHASLFAERKAIYEMSFLIMGLILILWSFPDLIRNLRDYINTRNQDPSYWLHTNSSDALIYFSLKLLFGILSVYFARQLSEILTKDKSPAE